MTDDCFEGSTILPCHQSKLDTDIQIYCILHVTVYIG